MCAYYLKYLLIQSKLVFAVLNVYQWNSPVCLLSKNMLYKIFGLIHDSVDNLDNLIFLFFCYFHLKI